MRHRLRPLMSAVALGLVLGVLLTPVGIAHLDLVPDACDRPVSVPSPASLGFSASPSSFDLHDHCFTCHWLQSFRTTLLASGAVVLGAEGACPVQLVAAVRLESVARLSLPARAPPSAL